MPKFYEFFAGAGMARAGLGSSWTCLLANDNSPMKRDCYVANWRDGVKHFKCDDVAKLSVEDLRERAHLAWASFPCQDLSLAGNYAGIGKAYDNQPTRSGAFWGFWKLIEATKAENKQPPIVVLENVYGVLTANGGEDFRVLGEALTSLGYRFGALLIDAVHFLPQSRPRVFIVAVAEGVELAGLSGSKASDPWQPAAVQAAYGQLSEAAKSKWVWWKLRKPPRRRSVSLEDIVTDSPQGVQWHSEAETNGILTLMSSRDRTKLELLQESGRRRVATVYKRTRGGEQRAELRTDGIAGCLRTPGGGSSRQIVMIVQGSLVRSRLLAPREAALLMGLPKKFKLPARYNDAYHVAGDGVAVPAVRHLAKHLLTPLAQSIDLQRLAEDENLQEADLREAAE